MHDAGYYRRQAAHARRIAEMMHQAEERGILIRLATDLDDIAEDLERGAIEIRHPELLPQRGR